MARPRSSPATATPPAPPALQVPRADAEARITIRIEQGIELRDREIRSEDELDKVKAEFYTWSDYNVEMLTRIFTTAAIAETYDESYGIGWVLDDTWREEVPRFRETVGFRLRKLESIRERLELIPEVTAIAGAQPGSRKPDPANRNVFVVHGHDNSAKQETARVISKLGLNPIILAEQPNEGRTLIEKFEHNADVGFAVVILTPDDVGGPKGAEELQPRARQNVVFELGYFIGALRRARVCALYTPGVELPTDIHGVVWVEMDPRGRWHLELGREMKAARLPVDLNQL